VPADVARRTSTAVWAVFVVFAMNGLGVASWAARIPAVRDGLGYSEAQMGLLLLTGAIGSVLALPLSGMISSRLGAARSVVAFAVVCAVGYVAACLGVLEGSPLLVRAGLFVGGIGIGVWDAAMNLEGAQVEQRLGRAIMPRFHAAYSFGTVAGAGLGALAADAGVPLGVHVGVVVVLDVVAVAVAVRWFLPTLSATPAGAGVGTAGDARVGPAGADPAGADPGTAVPAEHAPHSFRDTLSTWREPRTLLVGLVVLAAALTEGAANDWVGLAVVDGFGAVESLGALGLALFLAAMTGTRLAGTVLIDRLGRVAVLRLSGAAALAGVLVFTLVPVLPVALLGVLLWGAGAALGFPLGMSAASDDPRRAGLRVATVSTIGYSAFFVGPALIGLLAEHTGYRHALLVLAVPVALGLVVAGAARPLRAGDDRAPGATVH
jgi:predicted MFS family arabinose efflux permease